MSKASYTFCKFVPFFTQVSLFLKRMKTLESQDQLSTFNALFSLLFRMPFMSCFFAQALNILLLTFCMLACFFFSLCSPRAPAYQQQTATTRSRILA